MIATDTPPSTRSMPAWLPVIARQLSAFRGIQENWDGYGAAATKPEIIDAAERFLESWPSIQMLSEPAVVPSRRGGLMFLWKLADCELEIELISADEAEFLFSDRTNGTESEGRIELRSGVPPELSGVLKQFAINPP